MTAVVLACIDDFSLILKLFLLECPAKYETQDKHAREAMIWKKKKEKIPLGYYVVFPKSYWHA